MKKMFTTRLLIYMMAALLLTISAVFVLQTMVSKSNHTSTSLAKLEDVKAKLDSNEENIRNLTENLSQDNLAKTRAFADLIAADPSIIKDSSKLNEIKDRLKVNELHVIDENGIITESTIESYVGFDMKSGEQSNAFMVIAEDPSIEIAQEPQVNVAEGVVMQYIGVARKDAPGLVQIGVHPEVLEKILVGTEIDRVLSEIEFGKNGYVYAIDADSGQILAHENESLIGKNASEAGFSSELIGSGKAVIDGERGYYQAKEYEGRVIGTFLPSNEYYSQRNSQTLVVSLSMALIFGLLLLMIHHLVENRIVRGINQISCSMKDIAEGDFGIRVNVEGNPEFVQLSESINKMVDGICHNLQENERLLDQQKEDMEQNHLLIRNVKDACSNLDSVSEENLESAESIYNGTGETDETTEKITQTQSQMELLKESMQRITDMSVAIEQIIDEINSIAQQTNMLSLNASIEAARAGEMGKGFAVVATQVGELAARSAQAAKETYDLITNSIKAVEDGKEITDQTVEAFGIVVKDIEHASHNVEKITSMVRSNMQTVDRAVSQIERIAGVVEQNAEISHNTKQVSAHMAEITGKLLEIVETN